MIYSRFLLKQMVLIVPLLQVAHAAMLPGQQNKQELDRLERQSNQFLIEEAKRTEALLQKQRALRGSEEEGGLLADSQWKFKVDKIVILDDDRFDSSPQREEIVQRYVGKELGKAEIFSLVKELTDFYIARGYATTLISIEPGNIKSGSLTLRVLWGKINDFKVNGQEPSFREHMRLFTAYPFAKGKVLNMQDIDQSVENLLRVSDADNIHVQPSVINGYSDLNLLHQPSFPVSLTAGLNNSGTQAEGWQQYYGSFTGKNIAGLNDIFNAYYSWNNLNNPDDKQDSWSFSYGVPLGYWGFDANYYKSQYTKSIDGGYDIYESDGNSERASLRVSRMLMRGATGKTSAWMKVERRDNYNGIEHSQIDVSSKKYTSLASGLTYVGALGGGWVYGDIGVTAGVPWFGSAWKGDPDLEGFDLNYIKYNGIVSWTRPLYKVGRLGVTYELNSGFQYSPDVLVSDAKVTIGDEYTVRGFKDDNVMSDSGAWIANTLQFPFDVGVAGVYQLTPYMGYDLGFTKDNCPEGVDACDGQFMMGASVGIKASGKYFSSYVMAGWPIRKPDSMDEQTVDDAVVYYKTEITF
ncbi:ShlB/FhaC/HecB family hemolysin secretion/activation protein [Citrobacter sedlakii]|uniref:ShlB/FhaC/HecB family hemolysin secretion/activation protein n=1 Tax=Citrobacter TaxID=544 RepID=UPI001969D725|nr:MULTISPECIES: ShlB/FhaC/HecB family hemolysin secretion/activation protein [Citrobacter]MBM9568926.1 ShlB/FhaC/HecB family hemolysin secretion/activation protein [Citrobacter sedlakii]HBL4690204.1 ShlB/FhaC/HecB family hemolysin secretion/activation protein [Citrobacter sedlakii]HBL4704643.1 ShlB/FhaC/HecB family hemolysin secretion/activation protein [Citrobacter sedlakii]HBL4719392.1 ShlB/FhaC/HecB family hemolysin secretion/activation protein [Citrobacter sedlakii]HCA7840343.1 ShlB/FhaC/